MDDLGFDYDLDEIVENGRRRITLRSAVIEHIEEMKMVLPAGHIRMPVAWFRDQGKQPSIFEANHLEALARLSDFKKFEIICDSRVWGADMARLEARQPARPMPSPIRHEAHRPAPALRADELPPLRDRGERRIIGDARRFEGYRCRVKAVGAIAGHAEAGDAHGFQAGDCRRGWHVPILPEK